MAKRFDQLHKTTFFDDTDVAYRAERSYSTKEYAFSRHATPSEVL